MSLTTTYRQKKNICFDRYKSKNLLLLRHKIILMIGGQVCQKWLNEDIIKKSVAIKSLFYVIRIYITWKFLTLTVIIFY